MRNFLRVVFSVAAILDVFDIREDESGSPRLMVIFISDSRLDPATIIGNNIWFLQRRSELHFSHCFVTIEFEKAKATFLSHDRGSSFESSDSFPSLVITSNFVEFGLTNIRHSSAVPQFVVYKLWRSCVG